MDNITYIYNHRSDNWIISLKGEVDIYTVPGLKKLLCGLLDEKIANLSIDCRELDYMDSTGLGVLISVLKRVKEQDKNVYIKNPKPNVKKLFSITGLDKIFILED